MTLWRSANFAIIFLMRYLLFLLGLWSLPLQAQNWLPSPTYPATSLSDLQFWDDKLWLSSFEGQLYSSQNEGQTWVEVPLPFPARALYGLYSSRNRWFAAAPGGFYTSENLGSSWRWVSIPGMYVPSGFAVLGNGHWVVATADLVGGRPHAAGMLRSMDEGRSWESVTANLPGTSIAKLLQTNNDQLVVALDQPATTASLFSCWLGPAGSFQWMELPIYLHYQSDSSRAAFQASSWFDLKLHNDSTLLLSADGMVREAGATNAVYVQWMGYRKLNTGSAAEFWVETLPFRPQFNSWWDQAAPANILQHSETGQWYGSLRGGSARGGAWLRPSEAQGWHKANNGIPPGPEGWDLLRFAEGPYGRVFAIHQGYSGVFYTDYSRRWASATPHLVAEKLKLWPNPGDGLVQLDLAFEAVKLQVLDAKGQLVWQQDNLMSGIHKINLRTLAAGVYVIRAFSQTNMYQMKYVKGG